MEGAINKVSCFHCGENCEQVITYTDKSFCCEGCRTVYEILEGNNLCNYYNIESKPGISFKEKRSERFDFLDNPDVRENLINFRDEEISITEFYLPQIHCSSCIWLLENLHKLNPEIKSGRVNFLKKELIITFYNEGISLREVAELLSSLGYSPEINLNDLNEPKKKKLDRTLVFQVGIAGFCFGNIMLISLPEYFGLDNLSEFEFARFFSLINIILALPVTLYSAKDYFRSGLNAIKNKSVNIDVPIAIGIFFLFTRSVYEILSQTGPGYMDSLAGLVFFLLLGKIFQQKTYNTLSFERDYKSYFPVAVTRLGIKEESIPVSELKKGDRILIRNEELIPVDSILISNEAQIDNSFVTGESSPVDKLSGDKIFAGGKQVGNAIELEVINELSKSYLTKIWENEDGNAEEKQLTNLTDKISKYFTIAILCIASITFIYWIFVNPTIAFNTFTAVLIIACPCALALSAPFTVGNVLRIFGKEKFYVKNGNTLENLSKTNHIVFDKTGTLTQNKKVKIDYSGEKLTGEEVSAIKSLFRQSSHPLSKMLYEYLPESGTCKVMDFEEVQGKGVKGFIENKKISAGSKTFIGENNSKKNNALSTVVFVKIDNKIKGAFSFENQYRQHLLPTIKTLKKKHGLSMISGDNEGEMKYLEKVFGNNTQLLFNQKPEDKSRYIEKLKKQGKKVMMVGDGLNDAGALMKSNSGVSVSEDINTFSPACDAILDASKFHRLPDYLAFSRLSTKIIISSFIISFLYNLTGLFFAVQGLLSPVIAAILMPLSSITVVGFVTLSTNIAARMKKLG